MTSAGGGTGGYGNDGAWKYEAREPGARRRKLAGYLRAANELRQTYQQSYMQSWNNEYGSEDRDPMPGSFPNTKSGVTVRSGEEEMILFPSYAKKHVNQKPSAVPGRTPEAAGAGSDGRDMSGSGDAEYWRTQWEQYEDENAIVDVDVRGWIFTPHKGSLNRKNRLFVGLARQMVGIPAPTTSPSASASSSRSSSPHPIRKRVEAHNAKHEEELVAKEAEILTRKGEAEADAAHKGAYSEGPAKDTEDIHDRRRDGSLKSLDEPHITPVETRQSWSAPAQMSQAELNEANSRLMSRLKPFLANPLGYIPISAFFYNDKVSRQKTIDTDAYGHFNLRVALDFVPTHVRILASESLSATEEVQITDSTGISVISDVDDTIKHSAVVSGAREIFRNVFIRDLSDLTIQGVKDWYVRLADMGVTFHYVSNSPWQLYPLLKSFCSMAGLPKGSFHLKQYSGMFQGIFEPVAERKKGTLERLIRDFPERRFLLIGDSGEADLEVYTDIVLENPGRVLGVYIRDVTTSENQRFFDSSMRSTPSESTKPRRHPNHVNGNEQKNQGSGTASDEDDAALKAGIAASLREFKSINPANGQSQESKGGSSDEERPKLPPRTQTEPAFIEEDLIDLASDDENVAPVGDNSSDKPVETAKPSPVRPPKPRGLSSAGITDAQAQSIPRKPAPPRPRKPSTSVNLSGIPNNNSSPLTAAERSMDSTPSVAKEKPSVLQPSPQNLGYSVAARQKLNSAFASLTSPSDSLHRTKPSASQQPQPRPLPTDPAPQRLTRTPPQELSSNASSNQASKANSVTSNASEDQRPPLPARKPILSYPAAAAQYATDLYNAATVGSSSSLPRPSSTSSSPATVAQRNVNNRNGNSSSSPSGYGIMHSNSFPMSFVSSGQGQNGAPTQASKKEELWNRRWARAEAILKSKGVVLRSWRVGSDVAQDVIRLVEKAQKKGNLINND